MYGGFVVAERVAEGVQALRASKLNAGYHVASIVAVILLTYFHIVLGEMVPKSLALQRPQRTALWVAPVIEFLKTVCYPVVMGLNGLGNITLKLFGVSRRTSAIEHFHTPEELEYIVRESQEGGLLRRESAQVLQELFKFGELAAR